MQVILIWSSNEGYRVLACFALAWINTDIICSQDYSASCEVVPPSPVGGQNLLSDSLFLSFLFFSLYLSFTHSLAHSLTHFLLKDQRRRYNCRKYTTVETQNTEVRMIDVMVSTQNAQVW